MICSRCKKETNVHNLSFLNLEEICPDCAAKERKHPVYGYAKEIERKAVQNGDYNFPGVLEGMKYNTEAEANLLARLKYGDCLDETFKAWDSVINNISYNAVKMAELIKENNIDYRDEAKSWIAQMSILGRVDGRNEAAQEACKKVGIEFAKLTPLTKNMSRNHPTIQQQYTATMLTIYTGEPTYLPYI